MSTPCEQEAKIVRIDTEMIGIKGELTSINKKMTVGMSAIGCLMTAILVAVCIGMFNLGRFMETMESIQEDVKIIPVLQEKVSALEDVVFIKGIYKQIEEINNAKK